MIQEVRGNPGFQVTTLRRACTNNSLAGAAE